MINISNIKRLSIAFMVAGTLVACGGGGSGSGNGNVTIPPSSTNIGTISYNNTTGAGAVGQTALSAQGGQLLTANITSKITPYTYPLNIYLPPGYSQSSTPLPIIYATDSQYQFQDIVQTLQTYNISAIVVAVNYIDDNERAVDYLLPGAQAYFNFMTQELIPMIETQYRVDPTQRTIAGYSYSGVFSVLAMFYDNPSNRYFSSIISTDGSFFTDPGDEYALEAKMYAASSQLPVKLLMTCAANCDSALPMFNVIATQGFKGVKIADFTDFTADDHGTVVAPSIADSIKAIFGVAN